MISPSPEFLIGFNALLAVMVGVGFASAKLLRDHVDSWLGNFLAAGLITVSTLWIASWALTSPVGMIHFIYPILITLGWKRFPRFVLHIINFPQQDN
jgi:hypothetical protein